MTPDIDHYKILDVHEKASQDEVKTAWRKIAMKLHPDKNPGDKKSEEAFKRASASYEIIGDPTKRAQYDVKRARRSHIHVPGPHQGYSRETEIKSPPVRPVRPVIKTADLELKVKLENIYRGDIVDAKGKIIRTCQACHGQKVIAVGGRRCPECDALGSIASYGPWGIRSFKCPRCKGTGRLMVYGPCQHCHGKGTYVTDVALRFKLPGTTRHQDILSVRLTDGDIVGIKVMVKSLGVTIEGDNLLIIRNISALRGLKGTSVVVKTPDARKLKVKIPPNTQEGARVRLKEQGLLKHSGDRGDMFLIIAYSIPKTKKKK
jgi:molecular chaperone DnaJ